MRKTKELVVYVDQTYTKDTGSTSEILASLLNKIQRRAADSKTREEVPATPSLPSQQAPLTEELAREPKAGAASSGRYDFDLAEFPLFHYAKRRTGKNNL